MTAFADLHVPGSPLVLANAWDAASAAVIAALGARAIATTSGGVAWSLGLPDGNALTAEQALEVGGRIVRAVDVPVSVDLESGFSADAAAVADLAWRVSELGAAGINLEDTWRGAFLAPEVQAARIARVRAAAPTLFVNARTDCFLYGLDDAFAQTVARARAAVDAGADGVFVPGLVDLGVLERLVAAVDAPIAVMASRGGPSVAAYAGVGVARVSVGTDLAESAYRQLRDEAAAFLGTGDTSRIGEPYGYGALNALFAPRD